jgi:hypothetical protein
MPPIITPAALTLLIALCAMIAMAVPATSAGTAGNVIVAQGTDSRAKPSRAYACQGEMERLCANLRGGPEGMIECDRRLRQSKNLGPQCRKALDGN